MLITGGGGGRRTCAVCGAPHASCGPATSTTPVDLMTVREVRAVGERQQYRTKMNGYDTVLNLTEDEQKQLYPDAEPVAAPAPAPKARVTQNKARTTTENK